MINALQCRWFLAGFWDHEPKPEAFLCRKSYLDQVRLENLETFSIQQRFFSLIAQKFQLTVRLESRICEAVVYTSPT